LRRFASEEGFAVQAGHEKPWRAWVNDALAEIAALGLPSPPPYGHVARDGWRPIDLDQANLPQRYEPEFSRLQVLHAVDCFIQQLLPGQSPTDNRWRVFGRARREV